MQLLSPCREGARALSSAFVAVHMRSLQTQSFAVQDLVALNAALAELDESSADASCLQALKLAADRLLALLSSGTHVPPHLLCQVASSSDLSAQHDSSIM